MAKKKNFSTARITPNNKWEAESALDTLIRAEEVKSDKKMMARVSVVAKQRQRALNKVKKK